MFGAKGRLMKIASLKLHPAAAERQYGTVIAQEGGLAKRTVAESHFLFVEATTDDGLTGWGEISDIELEEIPQDTGEYSELLAAFMKGRSPFDVQRMHHDFRQHFDLSNGSLARYTACALDMAMYDLQGKRLGRPIYDLLGGAVRREVTISWVAYIREELDLLREEIRQRVSEGFRAFKLKVGLDIELDEARLAVLRETAGKEASLKIDANAGWSVSEAPKNIRRLAKFRLAGVETPVPRENPADIAAVRKQVDTPILEHVNDAAYGLALVKAEAVDVFNVATTGAGGIWPARQIVSLAEAAGIGVLLGSTVEQGPGTLAQLHLAAITPNLTLPSDLIGPGMYKQDVLREPLHYRDGKLAIPTSPGLGGEIDRAKLSQLAP
jgi:L-alanine-DL-glutamate epimerase-like enolase superfamily enzyme